MFCPALRKTELIFCERVTQGFSPFCPAQNMVPQPPHSLTEDPLDIIQWLTTFIINIETKLCFGMHEDRALAAWIKCKKYARTTHPRDVPLEDRQLFRIT
jgi:hypothetical protein